MLQRAAGAHHRSGRRGRSGCSGSPSCSRPAVGDKTAALVDGAAGVLRGPAGDWPRERAERLAAETGSWADWSRPTRRRCPSVGRAGGGAAAAGDAGPRLRARAGQPRGGDRAQPAVLALDPADSRGGAGARAAVRGHRAARRAAGDLRQEAGAGPDRAEKRQVRFQLASLYEDEIRDAEQGHRAVPRHPEAEPERPAGAAGAGPAVPQRPSSGPSWSSIVERELELGRRPRRAGRAEVPPGRGPREGAGREEAGGGGLPGRLRSTPRHAGRAGRAGGLPRRQEAAMTAVEALEPIYEKREDLPRLVEVLRIRLEHAEDTGKRVALQLRIGALESAHGPPAEASFDAYAEAFREDPASQPARTALEELADNLGRWDAWSSSTARRWRGRKLEPGARARAAAGGGGGLRREAGQVARRRSSTSSAPRRSSPRTRRRWRRWSGCTPAPSAGPTWSRPCARRPSCVAERRGARARSTSRSPPCGRRRSATPTRRSPPGRRCWATTPAACRRCARWIACSSSGAWTSSWPTTCSGSWS